MFFLLSIGEISLQNTQRGCGIIVLRIRKIPSEPIQYLFQFIYSQIQTKAERILWMISRAKIYP